MKTCIRCKQEFPKTLEYFYKNGKYLRSCCKECIKINSNTWHKANPEKVKAIQEVWRKANRKKAILATRAWRFANPEKMNAHARKRRASKKNNGHEPYTEKQMFDIYGTNCYLCDMPIDLDAPRKQGFPPKKVRGMWHFWRSGLHIDHVLPISKGGPDILENVRPSHGWCNLSKGSE